MGKDQAFYEFGKSAKEIAKRLESDAHMDQTEQLLLENHLYLLGMTYAGWKLRNSATLRADKPKNDHKDDLPASEASS
jgi:hypothetical protein